MTASAPWRRIRDGLFQTRDGRWRATWIDGEWWIVQRTPEGDAWVDTRPLLRDVKKYVTEQYELEEVQADAYHLDHREGDDGGHSIIVMRGGIGHARIDVTATGAQVTVGPAGKPFDAELAEGVAMALAEAAMIARALEHGR